MLQISSNKTLKIEIDKCKQQGAKIIFVPTMGNLHQGHFGLVELAKKHGDKIIASIFVNPTQFGPKEDFASYPRTLEQDRDGLIQAGCDILFTPTLDQIYPFGANNSVRVEVPESVTQMLCGLSRPGHFSGVATVVAKLFNIVQPHTAIFGLKDYQQLMVIRRMIEDLNMPIEIIAAPTKREADGLAMSSRNQYLNIEERGRAASIYRNLERIRDGVRAGHPVSALKQLVWEDLTANGFEPDYVEIRKAINLNEPDLSQNSGLIALIAARLGRARLIDNMEI